MVLRLSAAAWITGSLVVLLLAACSMPSTQLSPLSAPADAMLSRRTRTATPSPQLFFVTYVRGNGTSVDEYETPDGLIKTLLGNGNRPLAIAADGSGTLYYADDKIVHELKTPSGQARRHIRGAYSPIAVSGRGDMYAQPLGTQQILWFKPLSIAPSRTSLVAQVTQLVCADETRLLFASAQGRDGETIYAFRTDLRLSYSLFVKGGGAIAVDDSRG